MSGTWGTLNYSALSNVLAICQLRTYRMTTLTATHRLCHIGVFFDTCWNTDMSVSTLEVSLLCYEQYFNLQCLDIIYLLISPNVR